MRGALACLLFVCAAFGVRAEDAVRAVRLSPGETIRLDGSLSHPAWQRAPRWTYSVETQPVDGAAPAQATHVQVLFDEHALYVGVTALDTAPGLIRDLPVRNDGVNRTQDFVVVYVDPIGTKQSAQWFRVNAAGSMADGIHTAADDSEDFAPDFDWDAAVQRNAHGWTAVLRLPFASLRYGDNPNGAWRFMVARRLPREHFHLSATVRIPRGVPSFIHTLQPLEGVELPARHQFVIVRPSVTLRRSRDEVVGGSRTSGSELDASLDVKWRPRAELVVDATLNPDFSQLALDVPQLAGNTRFALSFPEKRPFFFESADLLRTPSEAFYTRTFTAPRYGVRGTWRTDALAGTALVVSDRGGGLVLLPGAYGTDAAEQPRSTTLAARGRWGHGSLQHGAVLASRRYDGDRGDNHVAGPDVEWALPQGWQLRGQWLESSTTAQPDGHGGLARGDTVAGRRLLAKLTQRRENGETTVTIDEITAGFRHDTGFVYQAGVRSIGLFHNRAWRPLGPFNEFFATLSVERQTDRATGAVVKEDLRPGIYANAARNLEWSLELHPLSRVRTSPGAPLLHERYVYTSLVYTPAPWFPFLDANLAVGRLADTVANQVRNGARGALTTKVRPLRPLELEASHSTAWLDRDGGRAYAERVSQLLAVWHLDARSNLRTIVQRTSLDRRAEPGVAAAAGASSATSVTYTWRRSAGSVLYVGASRSSGGRPTAQRGSEVFVKLQLDTDDLTGWL